MSEKSAVEMFAGRRVAVIGDVMLDRFVYGQVERISPEAPIPVLHAEREEIMPGGAANVARNIAALGGTAILIGLIGEDADGKLLTAELARTQSIESWLLTPPQARTIVKTRFVSGGQQMLRLDVEDKFAADETHFGKIVDAASAAIDGADAVVVSDYAKGLLTPAILQAVMAAARRKKISIVADPKARNLSRYAGARIITPNAAEALAATGCNCRTDSGAEAAVRAVLETAGVQSVVLTRGAQGVTIFGPQDGVAEPQHIPALAQDVFDVSGAGDTMAAVLGLAVAADLPLSQAARIANVAAGLVVAKRGTAVVHPDELARALLEASVSSLERKIVSRAELVERVGGWRTHGLRIGFTNGCFDLIHPGHVRLLSKARAVCDRLVVALNSDDSVRRLKGLLRPVQDEAARSIVLAAIADVDLVCTFDEDTPILLIEALKPDVLVKGADYRPEEVVGADFVLSYGGRLELVELEDGHSTSSMILRARQPASA